MFGYLPDDSQVGIDINSCCPNLRSKTWSQKVLELETFMQNVPDLIMKLEDFR